jgi:hypothetical protein
LIAERVAAEVLLGKQKVRLGRTLYDREQRRHARNLFSLFRQESVLLLVRVPDDRANDRHHVEDDEAAQGPLFGWLVAPPGHPGPIDTTATGP